MYHYVRDLRHSRYPEIKGLDLNLFIEQIEYLKRHYSIITMEQLILATHEGDKLPHNAVLLTFDDAYIDHYTNVFPVLEKRKLQGSFFTPVKAITENKILDVNKIHFILASVNDKSKLVAEIYLQLDKYREAYNLENNKYYYTKLATIDRYDIPEILFIKRLLQVELVEELRTKMIDELFRKFVSSDEISFSRELYMNTEQIECLQRNGMHIGGHGNNHYWLGSLSKDLQYIELNKSLEFIKSIGGDENKWTMCYPYGNYNNDTIDLLTTLDCKLAFTTHVDIANLSQHNKFKLPRLDTNDIPKDRNSNINEWYNRQLP
jgi:peptidoglycan/xylan/chitin deacetylase (PgdA/CDA1 family)